MLNNIDKGILIFATRHTQYGRLAYNLALSIKAAEGEKIPVAVVYTEGSLKHLSEEQLQVFDYRILLPEGAPDVCGCKLWADLITPFEKTLLLDADMLWLPKRTPEDMFRELDGVEFTSVTEGYHIAHAPEGHQHNARYFFWADPVEIQNVYNLPEGRRIYQYRSETMYFILTDAVKKFFDDARKAYFNPNLQTRKYYGAGVPDELAVNISAAVNDMHPHVQLWQPAYWHMLHNGGYGDVQAIYARYYLATFGSNMANNNSRDFYDKLMKAYCYRMGVRHIFPLQNKRDYIPERHKI